jgi:hypothetical protein
MSIRQGNTVHPPAHAGLWKMAMAAMMGDEQDRCFAAVALGETPTFVDGLAHLSGLGSPVCYHGSHFL